MGRSLRIHPQHLSGIVRDDNRVFCAFSRRMHTYGGGITTTKACERECECNCENDAHKASITTSCLRQSSLQFACRRRLHLHTVYYRASSSAGVTLASNLGTSSFSRCAEGERERSQERESGGGVPIISCEQTLLICSRLPSACALSLSIPTPVQSSTFPPRMFHFCIYSITRYSSISSSKKYAIRDISKTMSYRHFSRFQGMIITLFYSLFILARMSN